MKEDSMREEASEFSASSRMPKSTRAFDIMIRIRNTKNIQQLTSHTHTPFQLRSFFIDFIQFYYVHQHIPSPPVCVVSPIYFI